jgi:hypothetical protein
MSAEIDCKKREVVVHDFSTCYNVYGAKNYRRDSRYLRRYFYHRDAVAALLWGRGGVGLDERVVRQLLAYGLA